MIIHNQSWNNELENNIRKTYNDIYLKPNYDKKEKKTQILTISFNRTPTVDTLNKTREGKKQAV